MPVTVRLFAAAREAAGMAELVVPPGSVAQVCQAAEESTAPQQRARLAAVLAMSTLLLDGAAHRSTSSTEVPDGAVLDVLPPFAGG